jgi:hypothetical protein
MQRRPQGVLGHLLPALALKLGSQHRRRPLRAEEAKLLGRVRKQPPQVLQLLGGQQGRTPTTRSVRQCLRVALLRQAPHPAVYRATTHSHQPCHLLRRSTVQYLQYRHEAPRQPRVTRLTDGPTHLLLPYLPPLSAHGSWVGIPLSLCKNFFGPT